MADAVPGAQLDTIAPSDGCNETSTSTNIPSASVPDIPYKQLNRKTDEIRLIEVLPQSFKGLVRCRTVAYALEEAPQYSALSYRWGNADSNCTIELDGRKRLIRKNLLRFLAQIPTHLRNSFLWIDALCIDQANQQERTHQVGMMARIYSHASLVLVWLGPQYGHSDLAMKFLASDPKTWTQQRMDKVWRSNVGEAIQRLCERAYWTRLWMVQELMLARTISILCGRNRIPWENFELFLHHVDSFPPECRQDHRMAYHLTITSRAMEMIRQVRRGHKKDVLYDQTVAFAHLSCSDPRDKVYALLSISQQERDSISADYTIGTSVLLNRLLHQEFHTRPPLTMQDVFHRASRLSKAVSSKPDTVFMHEKADNNERPDSLQPAIDCPWVHRPTGISLWWCLLYEHKSVQDLWLQDPRSTTIREDLIQAAERGCEQICEQICNLVFIIGEADGEFQDEFGLLIVAWAAMAQQGTAVDRLLAHEDIFSLEESTYLKALRHAVRDGGEEAIQMVHEQHLHAGQHLNRDKKKLLLKEAVRRGDRTARFLLDALMRSIPSARSKRGSEFRTEAWRRLTSHLFNRAIAHSECDIPGILLEPRQSQNFKIELPGVVKEHILRSPKRIMKVLLDAFDRMPIKEDAESFWACTLEHAIAGDHTELTKLLLKRASLPAMDDLFANTLDICEERPATFRLLLNTVEAVAGENKAWMVMSSHPRSWARRSVGYKYYGVGRDALPIETLVDSLYAHASKWAAVEEGGCFNIMLEHGQPPGSHFNLLAGILGAVEGGCCQNMCSVLDMVDATSDEATARSLYSDALCAAADARVPYVSGTRQIEFLLRGRWPGGEENFDLCLSLPDVESIRDTIILNTNQSSSLLPSAPLVSSTPPLIEIETIERKTTEKDEWDESREATFEAMNARKAI